MMSRFARNLTNLFKILQIYYNSIFMTLCHHVPWETYLLDL